MTTTYGGPTTTTVWSAISKLIAGCQDFQTIQQSFDLYLGYFPHGIIYICMDTFNQIRFSFLLPNTSNINKTIYSKSMSHLSAVREPYVVVVRIESQPHGERHVVNDVHMSPTY